MRATEELDRGSVTLEGTRLDYAVRYSRSAKRRRIRVTPLGVEVVVPQRSEAGAGGRSAAEFLSENASWVLAQLDFVKRLASIRRKARAETLLLRGRERSVRVVEEATSRKYGVVAEGAGGLTVHVPTGRADVAGRALELWLRRQARADLVAAVQRRARRMRVGYGRLYVMGQRTRWGGCSGRGNLSFNWRLVMAPAGVLEYIVVHELAHLKEPSHSAKFWLIVGSHCPEFQRHKNWLRKNEWRLRKSLWGRSGDRPADLGVCPT